MSEPKMIQVAPFQFVNEDYLRRYDLPRAKPGKPVLLAAHLPPCKSSQFEAIFLGGREIKFAPLPRRSRAAFLTPELYAIGDDE